MILSLYNRFNNQCVKIGLLYFCILLDQKATLQSRSSLKLLTGQFLNGRPGSKPAWPYESASWRRSMDETTKSLPLTSLRAAFLVLGSHGLMIVQSFSSDKHILLFPNPRQSWSGRASCLVNRPQDTMTARQFGFLPDSCQDFFDFRIISSELFKVRWQFSPFHNLKVISLIKHFIFKI